MTTPRAVPQQAPRAAEIPYRKARGVRAGNPAVLPRRHPTCNGPRTPEHAARLGTRVAAAGRGSRRRAAARWNANARVAAAHQQHAAAATQAVPTVQRKDEHVKGVGAVCVEVLAAITAGNSVLGCAEKPKGSDKPDLLRWRIKSRVPKAEVCISREPPQALGVPNLFQERHFSFDLL